MNICTLDYFPILKEHLYRFFRAGSVESKAMCVVELNQIEFADPPFNTITPHIKQFILRFVMTYKLLRSFVMYVDKLNRSSTDEATGIYRSIGAIDCKCFLSVPYGDHSNMNPAFLEHLILDLSEPDQSKKHTILPVHSSFTRPNFV